MFYALLTLVALSGEVITTEHYAAPYPTLQACIVQANIMAGQKDCRSTRPDKPCMEAWVASCVQEGPK